LGGARRRRAILCGRALGPELTPPRSGGRERAFAMTTKAEPLKTTACPSQKHGSCTIANGKKYLQVPKPSRTTVKSLCNKVSVLLKSFPIVKKYFTIIHKKIYKKPLMFQVSKMF